MGLNQLTGTPWHKEKWTRDEDDPRRHRSRCVYHRRDNKCLYHKMNCYGSAHCDEYRETMPDNWKLDRGSSATKRTPDKADIVLQAKNQLPIGSRVEHKRFGEGLVEKYEDEGVVIHFYDFGKKTINIESCLRDGLLMRID